MSGWCSNHNEAPMRVGGDGDKYGRHDEKPKTLAQLFLPQLSTPTLCILSGLLIVLSNGLQFLEGRSLGGRTDNICPSEHSISNDPLVCRDGGSPTTTAVEALLLSLFQLRLFYPTLLLLTLVSLLRLQYNRQLKITRTTSAVPGVPSVPNAHPYFGHYRLLTDPRLHSFVFRDHATPSGISSMWGPGLKRCAAVLQASHARLVLKQNSQRDFRYDMRLPPPRRPPPPNCIRLSFIFRDIPQKPHVPVPPRIPLHRIFFIIHSKRMDRPTRSQVPRRGQPHPHPRRGPLEEREEGCGPSIHPQHCPGPASGRW